MCVTAKYLDMRSSYNLQPKSTRVTQKNFLGIQISLKSTPALYWQGVMLTLMMDSEQATFSWLRWKANVATYTSMREVLAASLKMTGKHRFCRSYGRTSMILSRNTTSKWGCGWPNVRFTCLVIMVDSHATKAMIPFSRTPGFLEDRLEGQKVLGGWR